MVLNAPIQRVVARRGRGLPSRGSACEAAASAPGLALAGLTMLFVAGCAPPCRMVLRPPDREPVILEVAQTCFSEEGDSFRLLAAVPSRPDSLSLISPDGGTPAYYVELTLPRGGGSQTAEVRVFIQTHHAVGLFGGTAHAVEWRECGNVILVQCRVLLMPLPDKALAGHALLYGADLGIEGEFRPAPRTYDMLDRKVRSLMSWLDTPYSLPTQ